MTNNELFSCESNRQDKNDLSSPSCVDGEGVSMKVYSEKRESLEREKKNFMGGGKNNFPKLEN